MQKILLYFRIFQGILAILILSFAYLILYANTKIDEISYQISEITQYTDQEQSKIKNTSTVVALLSSHKNVLHLVEKSNLSYSKANFNTNQKHISLFNKVTDEKKSSDLSDKKLKKTNLAVSKKINKQNFNNKHINSVNIKNNHLIAKKSNNKNFSSNNSAASNPFEIQ